MEHAPTTTALAGVISRRLAETGMSIREAAAKAGIPATTLNRRLTSTSSPFTVTELSDLASVLGTTPISLLRDANETAA